jgi:NADPH:quinone reductase-like Zn-dependent oxidoreductase
VCLVSPFLRQRLVILVAKERASDYERLTELIETGRIAPSLDRTYALAEVPNAMQQLDEGRIRGKIAILPSP